MENAYTTLQQFIQETMCQISSQLPEFYTRYYRKHFGLFFFWTRCRCHVLCRSVADALLTVMNAVAYHDWRWIFAVPLYHFLTNTVKPFARRSVHSSASHRKSEWWGIAKFERLVDRFKETWRANM